MYQNDQHWIRPLDRDIEVVFDKQENHYFQHGLAERWILKSDSGKLIGRVAAFINHKTSKNFDYPTGGMGFFECINDRDAAFLLFETCQIWLRNRGMEAMNKKAWKHTCFANWRNNSKWPTNIKQSKSVG